MKSSPHEDDAVVQYAPQMLTLAGRVDPLALRKASPP